MEANAVPIAVVHCLDAMTLGTSAWLVGADELSVSVGASLMSATAAPSVAGVGRV